MENLGGAIYLGLITWWFISAWMEGIKKAKRK